MSNRKENSTYSINEKIVHEECDLIYAINKLGGRWKLYILSKLEGRKMRYKELRDEIHPITERMLTLQLKALEEDKLVKRTVYADVPPRTEYELTEYAKKLIPIWNSLIEWGGSHKEIMKEDL
ncbi:transcriptional regulator, HxlR family [Chishuiella changwenlii]|uniref:Transcriptional regulator n=1 Tax=Chishuiella changwenlii TaxID=1434701 RepID=A0A1M6Z7R1_9FLAO|nr:helix-turn-helix domain-containing protein [Chishuiella changwenlii]GGE86910.1 transcriptional regulator [Chishuiella changwenlii]SHL26496.1 transcriptional regulator, HxlR family [Chishuiella changwenlii]